MNEMTTDYRRGIADVTQEIREETGQFLRAALRIGRLLYEAKAMVAPGNWTKYIEEELPFSHSWANNYMKLYKEYGSDQTSLFGNSQAFMNLRPTQALALLAISPEDREEFVEAHDVESMSTRQLQQAVREELERTKADLKESEENLDKAYEKQIELEKQLEDAQTDMEDIREDLEELKNSARAAVQSEKTALEKVESLEKQLQKAKAAEAAVKEDLKKARENPEIPDAVMEQMRKEIEVDAAQRATEALQKQLTAAQEAADAATKAKEAAERSAREAEEKRVAAEKAAKMQNPDVAVFQHLYIQLQETWNKAVGAYQKVCQSDDGSSDNCYRALTAAIQKFQSDIAKY